MPITLFYIRQENTLERQALNVCIHLDLSLSSSLSTRYNSISPRSFGFSLFFWLASSRGRRLSWLFDRPHSISFRLLLFDILGRVISSVFVCWILIFWEQREYSQIISIIIMIYTDSRFNVCTCYFRWFHLGCWISWHVRGWWGELSESKRPFSDMEVKSGEKPTGKLSHPCLFISFWTAETPDFK